MVVHAHAIAEFSAEERRCRHVENLAGEIPERHFDAADRADEVVRRPVGARPAQIPRALAHRHVQRVNLERILSDEPGLQRQHLLLHADAGASVGLRDAEQPVVCRDLHERVRAAPFEHHHLHVANLDALALRRGELVEAAAETEARPCSRGTRGGKREPCADLLSEG